MPDRAKVAVLISGRGTNMAALLYASRMAGSPYEVVLVASNVADAPGLALAEAEGIATFSLSHRGMEREAHDAAMDEAIRNSGAEYVALAGYMRILGESMVERWTGRLLNIHPSLLPNYPGLDTHARAIAAGDAFAGTTVHLVSSELDGGEILDQLKVAILPDDTAQTLADRVLFAEHQLYPRALTNYVSRFYDHQWILEQVRGRAVALPEAEERSSHGSPGWRTGGKNGKFFAYVGNYHDDDRIGLIVKTSGPDELSDLIARDPGTFYRPAYYGASGWVGLVLNRPDVDWSQVDYWLHRSWRAVAPKRLTKLLDAADEF